MCNLCTTSENHVLLYRLSTIGKYKSVLFSLTWVIQEVKGRNSSAPKIIPNIVKTSYDDQNQKAAQLGTSLIYKGGQGSSPSRV